MTLSMANFKASAAASLLPEDIGQTVRRAREALGYSVDDLAETCGLTAEEIGKIEVGADADTTRLRRVANALQMDQSTFG